LIIWGVPGDPVHHHKDKCIITHARAVNFFLGVRHLMARTMHHPPRLILDYLAGLKKSQNKNFDDHITTISLALMPKLTLVTMEVFLSLEKIPTFSGLKSDRAT
jgi:hypothetical protein